MKKIISFMIVILFFIALATQTEATRKTDFFAQWKAEGGTLNNGTNINAITNQSTADINTKRDFTPKLGDVWDVTTTGTQVKYFTNTTFNQTLNAEFSVDFWVMRNGSITDRYALEPRQAGVGQWVIAGNSSGEGLTIDGNSASSIKKPLINFQFHHINICIYSNGTRANASIDAEATNNATVVSNNEQVNRISIAITDRAVGEAQNWHGMIDQITLYEGCLNQSDILELNDTNFEYTTASDTTAPTYANNLSNTTTLFSNTSFFANVTWTDETGIFGCVPSLNNGSGTFVNQTLQLFPTGTTGVCNLTVTQSTAQASQFVEWRFYGNDTSKNMNETTIMRINVSNTAPQIITLTPSDGYSDRTNLSILINVTDIDTLQTLTVNLYVNGTRNISQSVTNGAITNITVTQMGLNSNYTWYVNVTDGITNTSSIQRSYIMDNINPIIRRSFINISLSPILTNLTLSDNCSDDNLFSYEINITNASGFVINISEVINTTAIVFNFTQIVNISKLSDGIFNVRHQCSDDHTKAEDLDKYNNTIDKDISTIKFDTQENIDSISIKLKSVNNNLSLKNMSIKRLEDRFGFGFNLSNGTNEDGTIYEYVFKITNKQTLIYRPFSQFPAHFVTSYNFIDFRMKDGIINTTYNYSVKQTNDDKFEVSIFTNKTDLVFESVGGLNIVEQNSTLIIDSLTPSISYIEKTNINGSNLSVNWIFVNVSITETGFKNITFYLYNSSGSNTNATFYDSTRSYNFSSLSDGTFNFNVTVYDNASNYNASGTRQATLDTNTPTISFIAPTPSNTSFQNITIMTLNVSINESNLKNTTFYVLYGNKTVRNESVYFNGTNQSIFGIGEGSFLLNATVYDIFNRSASTLFRNVTIDGTIPKVNSISPSDGAETSSATFVLSYSVVDVNLKNCSLWWGNKQISNYTATGSDVSVSYIYESQETSGSKRWYVECYDYGGNRNFTENRTLTIAVTSGGGGGGSSGSGSFITVPSLVITPTEHEQLEAYFGTCNTKVKPTRLRLNKDITAGVLQLFNYEQRNIDFNLSVTTLSGNIAEDFVSLNVSSLVMPYNSRNDVLVSLLTTNFVPEDMIIEINSNCGTRVIPIEYLGNKDINSATSLKDGLKSFFNKVIINDVKVPGSDWKFNVTSLGIMLLSGVFIFIFLPLSLNFGVYLSYFAGIEGIIAFIIWYLI